MAQVKKKKKFMIEHLFCARHYLSTIACYLHKPFHSIKEAQGHTQLVSKEAGDPSSSLSASPILRSPPLGEEVYLFPIATVTNDHKLSDIKQHRLMIF